MNSQKIPELKVGSIVECRSHRHLVEKVEFASSEIGDTVVKLACLDDDANGQITEVFWEREIDARVIGDSTWDTIGNRGFDDPKVFSSYSLTTQIQDQTRIKLKMHKDNLNKEIYQIFYFSQEPLQK